jgi:hypothetical protein
MKLQNTKSNFPNSHPKDGGQMANVAKWQILILNYWSSSLIMITKGFAITYLHAN